MSIVSSEIMLQLDCLQSEYIDALDSKDMEAWRDTFHDHHASYVCISAENEESGFPIAFMLDDCRARVEDRVTFINKVWAGTFEDYRTRHFVQRVKCVAEDDKTYLVSSNFSVFYTTIRNVSNVLAVGVYKDKVALGREGKLRFLEKRVIMDTNIAPQYLVYPL